MRNIRRIIFHHTAGSTLSGALQTLNQRGLHYHILIEANGNVHRMRDYSLIAFHAGNANSDSIGISLVGNFQTTRPTQNQLTTAALEVIKIFEQFGELQLLNHRDVSATLCPVLDLANLIKKEIIKMQEQDEPFNYPQETNNNEPSEWAKGYIEWANNLKLPNGDNFWSGERIHDRATRQEMVAMLHRLYQIIMNEKSETKEKKSK
jgi:hypothetical protein